MGYYYHVMVSQQIQVPDKSIGAILGKGGAVLRELQQQSGARISISKRGEYVPGTTNRYVCAGGREEREGAFYPSMTSIMIDHICVYLWMYVVSTGLW